LYFPPFPVIIQALTAAELQPDIATAKRFALVEIGSIKDAAQVFEKLRKTGFRLPALP
jgi:hypothetical protein